jgi:hypothetical protein
MDVENFKRTLHNGLKNKNPRTPLAWAIAQRKTLRFGNKADPFQSAEIQYKVSKLALIELNKLKWPVVIETKFTDILMNYFDILIQMKEHLHVVPIISPGFDEDWEIFEKKQTTHPQCRLNNLQYMASFGMRIGVNGEPFIPGYHTIEQFENMIKLLKSYNIPSYNVYNLHLNEFVLKRLVTVGVDIERVWTFNQDHYWRPILQKLIDIAKKYNIILGCPDFVNSGWGFYQKSNTCCGITVDNPCTFNLPTWKSIIQRQPSIPKEEVLSMTWDGVGSYKEGYERMFHIDKNLYSLSDICDTVE